MKTFMECVPCLVRQTYEAVVFATEDEAVRESLLRETLRDIAGIRLDQSPPHMATAIHRKLRTATGSLDPYRDIKARSNRAAMALCGRMADMVRSSKTPFETAIRLSIAGNVIDFGAPGCPPEEKLPALVEAALDNSLVGTPAETLRQVAERAETILVLGDNAGEIAFDRFLLEALGPDRCVYAVKGAPIINDATMDDARQVGLTEWVEVIDNGADAPGTILEWCSASFVERFAAADLVIAKGQGNYETLSGAPRPNLFFLLNTTTPDLLKASG